MNDSPEHKLWLRNNFVGYWHDSLFQLTPSTARNPTEISWELKNKKHFCHDSFCVQKYHPNNNFFEVLNIFFHRSQEKHKKLRKIKFHLRATSLNLENGKNHLSGNWAQFDRVCVISSTNNISFKQKKNQSDVLHSIKYSYTLCVCKKYMPIKT